MQHAYIADRLMKITNFHEKIDEFKRKAYVEIRESSKSRIFNKVDII